MAKVAFLGLGVMGYPMAGHLKTKGGHEVTVYNRSAAKAEQWAKEFGGKVAKTPEEAAAAQDFVMMCVGNDNDVRAVAGAAFPKMGRNTVFVDHTTALPPPPNDKAKLPGPPAKTLKLENPGWRPRSASAVG